MTADSTSTGKLDYMVTSGYSNPPKNLVVVEVKKDAAGRVLPGRQSEKLACDS